MSSSFPLMIVYAVLSLALQAVAVGIIILLEPYLAGWSSVIFMAAYLLIFWFAWSISVRLTEPKSEGAAAEAAQAGRA